MEQAIERNDWDAVLKYASRTESPTRVIVLYRNIALAAKGKYPKVRLHNRCSICGRPHGFHRDFGICRICLRKMAHEGLLPGVTKSSW